MKIIWFGHSTFRIETGASVLMIDPFLKGNPTFEASSVSFEQATQGVTHVALTHGHDDHVGSAAEICKANDVELFGAFELVSYIGPEKGQPMNHGGTVSTADFDITLVNALHSASTTVDGVPVYLGNPCGLIVRAKEGKSVYHMGDTDMFGGMSLIQEYHKPDIGIVPIGDRFTMGGKSAAFTCKKFFSFSTIFPCHYGTFPIIDETTDKFVAEMVGHNVVVPGVGEAVEV